MAREVVLRFLGDAGNLNRTFAAVEAQSARSMNSLQGSVASATGVMESRFGAVAASLAGASATMRRTGTRMAVGITAPLAFIAKTAIGTGIDYERNMNVLQAASGATGEQMASMGRLAEQLGADITLPGTSAADAAAAMLELSKAGLTIADSMGAARGVLQLSAAGGLDNASAASVAANALNAFRLEGSQAVRVADLLAGAANGSSAEVAELADSLSQGASVFAQARIPIEDFVSSAALLANVGIKGSDAGTSLKSMLLKLQNPTKEAAKELKSMGVDIYDAQGQMRPFRDLIGSFSQALGGMAQEQRDAALGTIFGSDAVRSANAVLLSGVDAFDRMKAVTTEQGAAAKMAAAQNKGLGGAIDGLKSALETFSLKVVRPALPMMAKFVTSVANFVPKLASLPQPVKMATLAFTGLLFVVGPLVAILGAIISPIALVVAGVGALAAAAYVAYQRSESFRAGVANIGAALGELVAWFRSLGPQVSEAIGHVVAVGLVAWRMFGDEVVGIARAAWTMVQGVFTAALTAVRNLIQFWLAIINGDWGIAWDAFKGTVGAMWDGIFAVFRGSFGILVQVLEGGMSLLRGAWNVAWEALGATVGGIFNGITSVITRSINFVIGLINKAISAYNAIPLAPNIATIPTIGEEAPAGRRIVAPGTAPVDTAARPTGAITGGRVIALAHGGLLLGVNRPTPLLVGEGRGKEDVLAVPHSKGGLAGLGGGVTQNNNFYGITYEEAAQRSTRQLGWQMALSGRR